MKFSRFFKVSLILALIVMNIGCDQVSKSVVRKKIIANDQIEVITKHLTLTKVENIGAAMGFGTTFHPSIRFIIIIIIPGIVLLILLVAILAK